MKKYSSKYTLDTAARHGTLDDWLAWLETLHPKEIDLGLERTRLVADRLGLSTKPNSSATLITVAGTNGKGSFVASIQALLNQSGARVGTYTSPHILAYNERIQIDGVPVSDAVICRAFEKIDSARMTGSDRESNSGNEISLSYFEFATLAALIIFEENSLDVWVLEVGLGGRLDATNIMDADIAVITSIAIDHEGFLGSTREAIAIEKAGIIRRGATVICADIDPPETLLEIIAEKSKDVFYIGQDFYFEWDKKATDVLGDFRFVVSKNKALPIKQRPNLPLPSVSASLQVYELLSNRYSKFGMAAEDLALTLENLNLAGRFERDIYDSVPVIFDVAHNPAATKHLSERLSSEGFGDVANNRSVSCVVAMMEDKDVMSSILPMANIASHWFCTQVPNFPRSMSSEALRDKVEVMLSDESYLDLKTNKLPEGNRVFEYKVFEDALNKAINFAKNNHHTLLIFGSFYTVAEAKNIFKMANLSLKNG